MNKLQKIAMQSVAVVGTLVISSCTSGKSVPDGCIYACDEYTVYTDRVTQGDFEAVAVSPTEITTTFKSELDGDVSSLVEFKFALNSRDNELMPDDMHYAVVGSDNVITYKLGEPDAKPEGEFPALDNNVPWTVRVDMTPMFESFKQNGQYITKTGDVIYEGDFRNLIIIGNVWPLTWEFENQIGNPQRELQPSKENPYIYELTINMNPERPAPLNAEGWKIDTVPAAYPQVATSSVLADAVYNMGIDDIISDIRPDETFRAGASWDGVWTRDVAYSIYLSLAYLDPQRSMNSLKFKVKNNRIVQDTGSGGSWPVSSDRIVWAMAAWEIYVVTGDNDWLQYAYNVIKNTIVDDEFTVRDRATGLMHGEQSYLDWREQTYAKWMETKDIYESMALGTNVLFAKAYKILGEMAELLGEEGDEWNAKFENLAEKINKYLWMPEYGYYSQYLYTSPYPIQSPSVEALGQSIAVIFDVADSEMAKSLVQKSPVTSYGTTSIYPMLPDIKPYHNNAIWPFVQSYWNLAARKAGNYDAVCHGIGSIYRAAAMYATNKELFVASTGDFRGTAINSDKQLWSAAGNASLVFRLYAGMNFRADGIDFAPYVPEFFNDSIKISNFRYRGSLLDIIIDGTGDKVKEFYIDGEKQQEPELSAENLGAHHTIRIVMEGKFEKGTINMQPVLYMPKTPQVNWKENSILNYNPNVAYKYYLNGATTEEITAADFDIASSLKETSGLKVLTFVPTENGLEGFAAQPEWVYSPEESVTLQFTQFAKGGTKLINGPRGDEYVETTTTCNTDIALKVNVEQEGEYFVKVRYCNGNGPINTESKCAIRSLEVNGTLEGPIVMPQRGVSEWLNPGYSNTLCVKLNKGENDVHLKYLEPMNVNMNGAENVALLQSIVFVKK